MQIHVIMPIGADPNYKKKKQIIETAILNPDVVFHFPDYCQTEPEFNLKSTLKDLEMSDLVFVDLSQERPSCYYELGLAQAIGKKIFIVAKQSTPIHQACGRENVNFYDNFRELKNIISTWIAAELNNEKANK